MKKSELVKLIREELQGYSPQIGKTKGLTPDTLNKILKKIASGDDYEPEGEMSERIRVLSPEKQKANDAAFDRRMATLKDLEKGKKLHKAGKISDEELHNLKLKAGTISADSKFTKKEIKGK